MKIIGVIPARYASTRFPGKPIVDICGKPMIWWVYQQAKKVKELSDVYIATDDEKIVNVCDKYNMKYITTNNNHPEHISRIHEVSTKINADFYICINGDEPLIQETVIKAAIPIQKYSDKYFCGLVRDMTNPVEVIDNANIKVVLNSKNQAIYMSRTPVPYPKGTLDVIYKKYVGVECFNKEALDFFVKSPMGINEKIEDIDQLRFIENGIIANFVLVESESLAVDTPKDLEFVKKIISKNNK